MNIQMDAIYQASYLNMMSAIMKELKLGELVDRQNNVEMNFSFLKDPYYTDEIYLKKPERVHVLGYHYRERQEPVWGTARYEEDYSYNIEANVKDCTLISSTVKSIDVRGNRLTMEIEKG